jgi:hypothetical protein
MITWITENNHPILYVDFTQLHGENFINQINDLATFLQQTKKTEIHALIDITNSYLNNNVFKEIEKTAKLANTKIKKTAIIGSTPVQKTFIRFLKTITNIQFNMLDTKEEALQWLTNH